MDINYSYFHRLTQKIKRRLNPFYYDLIYSMLAPRHVNTMNYGYAPVTKELCNLHISPDQCFQYELYYQTFKQLTGPLKPNQTVCEISCGRGGGLAFISKLTDAKIIGLERSLYARRYARKHFGLDVEAVNAPKLPLENDSVDVFISVEAAHNYQNADFVAEIKRCLKSGGVFLLADTNKGTEKHTAKKFNLLYDKQGMEIENWRDIRCNVLQAMERDHKRKQNFIPCYMVGPLKEEANYYLGAIGSHKYNELQSGKRAYFIMKARK